HADLTNAPQHLPCYHSSVPWNSWFRSRRMRRFARELHISAEPRVLDVAGAPSWVAGDGRTLPFRDEAFDVVFSNSVIEHVGDAPAQRRFAREVARVG